MCAATLCGNAPVLLRRLCTILDPTNNAQAPVVLDRDQNHDRWPSSLPCTTAIATSFRQPTNAISTVAARVCVRAVCANQHVWRSIRAKRQQARDDCERSCQHSWGWAPGAPPATSVSNCASSVGPLARFEGRQPTGSLLMHRPTNTLMCD